jgi:hypothetical protein
MVRFLVKVQEGNMTSQEAALIEVIHEFVTNFCRSSG